MGDEVCRQQGRGGNEIKAGAAEYSVILILVLYLTLVLRCEVPSKYVFPSRTKERSVQGAFTRLTPDLNLGGTPTLRGVVGPAWN